MATLVERSPDLAGVPTRTLLDLVQPSTLYECLPQIGEHYEQALPLWRVLHFLGLDVDEHDDQKTVPCLLPEHGTGDQHPSARYFAYDRDTNRRRGTVWCYKCDKLKTSLWMLYAVRRDWFPTLRDYLVWLEGPPFHVSFPRHFLLAFDPEKHYTLRMQDEERSRGFMAQAETLRNLDWFDPSFHQAAFHLMDSRI